jgi:conjugative transfer signal peptidase TraF
MKHRRALLLLCGVAALAAVAAAAPAAVQDRILFNHSPSVPVGLYLRIDEAPARGRFVTVRALHVAPAAARVRGFDGARDRFLKRVAAEGGDRVCAEGEALVINDAPPLPRRAHDSLGAPIPAWSGCRVLGIGEYLLLGDTPDSFDGRYWGSVTSDQIEGVWRRLP